MSRRRLRVAFVVQGEGRGHMTQALALAHHLRSAGHEISEVLVGRSPDRPLPEYFVEGVDAPVKCFRAPMLATDPSRKGMSAARTAVRSVLGLPGFSTSILRLRRRLSPRRADVLVNFYDLLTGISRMLRGRPLPSVCVAHNYLVAHPVAPVPSGGRWGRRGLETLNALSALRATSVLALSFDALPEAPGRTGLAVVPPLLRDALFRVTPTEGDHLLAYALNPGYGAELAAWHTRNPGVEVRCFIEGGEAGVDAPSRPGLTFHDLDDRAFLEALASCRAYVGSAGFESVCEAFFLGKPTLVVPTAGHYEQRFNALDAERAGAARAGTYADLDDFWRDPPCPSPAARARFRAWVERGPELIVGAVERAARG